MGCAPCAARARRAEAAARDANISATQPKVANSGRTYELIDSHTGQVVASGEWSEVKAAQARTPGSIRTRKV